MKKKLFISVLCLVLLDAVVFQKPITRLLNYSSGTFFDTVLSGKALPTRARISVSPLSENEETPFLTESQLDELNDFLTSAVLETVVKSSETENAEREDFYMLHLIFDGDYTLNCHIYIYRGGYLKWENVLYRISGGGDYFPPFTEE